MVEMAIGNLLPSLLGLVTLVGGFALAFASAGMSGTKEMIAFFSGVGLYMGGPLITSLVVKEKTSKYNSDKNESMDKGGWQEALYKSVNVNQAWTYGLVKDLITAVEKMEAQCNNLEQGRSKNIVKGLEDITSAISF